MSDCLVCGSGIEPFMSFGQMPIANGFLTQAQFKNEYFYEMEVAFCESCYMFQLVNQPDREQMFNDNYAFFSGTSRLMGEHFQRFANTVIEHYLANAQDPFVVEIGSNDGIMLKHFAQNNIRHLGVEPSANVAQVAMDKGVNTIVDFFDKDVAQKIVNKNGLADAFLAANVMCHIPYIKSIVEGIKVLLKPDGIVIFEDPYLGDVIEKTTYDQIYDEHTFLFSAHSVQHLFNMFDMELIDLEPQKSHGGSMRYVIAHRGRKKISENVGRQLSREKEIGLINPEKYREFRENCEKYKNDLLKLINEIKRQGKRIVGYAATSKSTTITNYCGITPQQIEFISDTTPIKQGKFSPGVHIPVRNHGAFNSDYPDYALLFGYNHEQEIMENEQEFIRQGGKWITYVPEVKVI